MTKPMNPDDETRSDEPRRTSLSESLEALRMATRNLNASCSGDRPHVTDPSTHPAADEPGSASPPSPSEPGRAAPKSDDPDARIFYERLEQTGQLADITHDSEIAGLPPHVTHVRKPDGSIERIGYSAY